MKIDFPIEDIIVSCDESGSGDIVCSQDYYETCPCCGQKECLWNCDESQEGKKETDDEVYSRIAYNGAIDGIMAMILAHACAGMDISTPQYVDGVDTAIQGAANNS